jgi:Mlc titration factor MtfA (ptsG expression regulator)
MSDLVAGKLSGMPKARWPIWQADEEHFFRKYAFDNMEEFFAVAVENFFRATWALSAGAT